MIEGRMVARAVGPAARADLGVDIGDEVEVRIELDDAPRQVDVPVELIEAWADRPAVAAAFQKLSYSHQREYAEWVGSAKKRATRDGRAATAIEMLTDDQTLE